MDMKSLLWEGPHPAVPPNMGHDLSLLWEAEDWDRFMQSVREAFPNVVFFVELKSTEERSPDRPELRIVDRFVGLEKYRTIKMLFPDPSWEPKYVRIPNKWGAMEWTLDQYWSPRIWFSGSLQEVGYQDWMGTAVEDPIAYWGTRGISTSYRRQIEREFKIQAKVLSLARKLGRRTVPIYWKSLKHFREGDGTVYRWFSTTESCFISPGTMARYRRAKTLALGLHGVGLGMYGFSRLPPEDVPDHFWGDVKKPKWVLEAIEKHRAKP